MADVILIVLAVEKAMRAKRHEYHYLWSAGKLVRCAEQAARAGWLSW
jgi:hypothetical protein